MDFESALEYLESFVSYEKMNQVKYDEKRFNLSRLRDFCREIGLDYSKIKFVHVAGSKGKGSVSTLIADYLSATGYSTGLFTSPHIIDVTERIRIAGEQISHQKFADGVGRLKDFIDASPIELTYFEVLTVLSLMIFVDEEMEYAVMEVGLGGRLDSTNIIKPLVCVLTRTEEEHLGILGNNVSEILDEKLGIVKDGVPLVVGAQTDEVKALIDDKMRGKKDVFWTQQNSDFSENANSAHAALQNLFGKVNEEIFARVIANFKLIGRFDVREINGKKVIFDMAHTPSSIANLIRLSVERFPDKKFIFLISILKGKKVPEILSLISPLAFEVTFTSSHKVRGLNPLELAKFWKGDSRVIEDPQVAFNELCANLKSDQVLVVTGSHFLLSEILKNF